VSIFDYGPAYQCGVREEPADELGRNDQYRTIEFTVAKRCRAVVSHRVLGGQMRLVPDQSNPQ
jgi:hypothetical protein